MPVYFDRHKCPVCGNEVCGIVDTYQAVTEHTPAINGQAGFQERDHSYRIKASRVSMRNKWVTVQCCKSHQWQTYMIPFAEVQRRAGAKAVGIKDGTPYPCGVATIEVHVSTVKVTIPKYAFQNATPVYLQEIAAAVGAELLASPELIGSVRVVEADNDDPEA